MSSSSAKYARCTDASEKVAWRLDDVLPPDATLRFDRHFLPEALVPTRQFGFLSSAERRALNHIAGHAYLNLFAFVEEYIVADVMAHAQAHVFGDEPTLRALLRFAEEEVKHQAMFKRFRELFRQSFPTECAVLSEAEAVAAVILSKVPLAVLLTTYHLELVTQAHYSENMRNAGELDPLFVNMLKHHWLEEAQHARLDELELESMIAYADEPTLARGFADYVEICHAFDGLLSQQGRLDVESLQAAIGRDLGEDQREFVSNSQHRSYRTMFLTMGMRHPAFVRRIKAISPRGAELVNRALDDWESLALDGAVA